MLHRSFKSAKCKTSLKLASARLKLLKNRKDVQVKQLKRELAQLLESGQEQTARIRVENVIREDKMVAAYDLLEIYCELIAARLQIIESQKNCPIDMKEAISSVIFAAPRCSDVTELVDVRKQFTAKYGKEFVSAAVEVRPDCGVSRMLVEKLSAKATDIQAKMKFLKEIADEHGVKWEPVLLEQNPPKPSHDFLDGPNTFVKAKIQADPPPPPPVQTTTPPTFQPPQSHYSMNSGNNTNERFNHEHENTSFKRPYSFHEEVFSPGVKNQKMEFENAAAAAKAAAESADIACRAAREAAEFASQGKLSRQPSTELHKSRLSDHSRNKEERRKDDRDSGTHSFQRRNSQLKDDSENHSGQKKPIRSDSLKSKASSIDDNAERYSPKNYIFSEHSSSSHKSRLGDHSRNEEERRKDDRDPGTHSFQRRNSQLKDDNGNHSGPNPIRSDSLKSKASSIDDNPERYSPKNYFFSEQSSSSHGRQSDNFDYYSEQKLTRKISSDKTSAVFDDSGSDVDDSHELDMGRNSQLKPEQFVNRSSSSSPQSRQHDDMPVSFDDSEGHSSEDETDKSGFYDHKPSKFSPPTIRRDSNITTLNLESLRGGFKHQKSRIPPYTSPTAPTAQINKKKLRDDSDSDGSDAAVVILPSSPSRSKRESSSFKQVNTPTRLQPKTAYLDSSSSSSSSEDDESETEQEYPAPSSNRVETSSSVLSWRTNPTPNHPNPTDSFPQRSEVNPPLPKQKEQLKMTSLSPSSNSMSTGEDSLKTKSTSHVHPKLPDYDDIAARLQALRVNRR